MQISLRGGGAKLCSPCAIEADLEKVGSSEDRRAGYLQEQSTEDFQTLCENGDAPSPYGRGIEFQHDRGVLEILGEGAVKQLSGLQPESLCMNCDEPPLQREGNRASGGGIVLPPRHSEGDSTKESSLFNNTTAGLPRRSAPRNDVHTPTPNPSPLERGRVAFTLAEVLITLGIIGVVAAMTLPAIIQKQQEKVTVTKLKKSYSVIQQAYLMAVNEKGPVETWGLALSNDDRDSAEEQDISLYNDKENILYHLKDYLKITKYCGLEKGCWYSTPMYALNGELFGYPDRRYYSKAILADGSMIMAYSNDGNSGFFRIDVNGKTPPNTLGKDIFTFEILNNKIVPWGVESVYPFDRYCNPKGSGADQGRGCTAWVLYNENMDYLHCDGLSWNGKHKCK